MCAWAVYLVISTYIYGSLLSNDTCLLYRITPTDVISNLMFKFNDKLPLELRLKNCVGNLNAYYYIRLTFNIVV